MSSLIYGSRPSSAGSSAYDVTLETKKPKERTKLPTRTLPILAPETITYPLMDLCRIEDGSPENPNYRYNISIHPSRLLDPHTTRKTADTALPYVTTSPLVSASASTLITTHVSTILTSASASAQSSASSTSCASRASTVSGFASETQSSGCITPLLPGEISEDSIIAISNLSMEGPKGLTISFSSTIEAPKTRIPSTYPSSETIDQILEAASKYYIEEDDGDKKYYLALDAGQVHALCTELLKWKIRNANFKCSYRLGASYEIHASRIGNLPTLFITPTEAESKIGGTKEFKKSFAISIDENNTISTKWVGRSMLRPSLLVGPPKEVEDYNGSLLREAKFTMEHQDQHPIMGRILNYHEYSEEMVSKVVIYSELYPLPWDQVPSEALPQIFEQLIVGLNGLNKLGFLHSDLKLDNIVVRQNAAGNYEVVIIDWGAVGALHHQTYHVRAPEFVHPVVPPPSFIPSYRRLGSPQSEVWALGCIFYLLKYKQEPRWGRYQIIYFMLQEFIQKISANPNELREVIEKNPTMFHQALAKELNEELHIKSLLERYPPSVISEFPPRDTHKVAFESDFDKAETAMMKAFNDKDFQEDTSLASIEILQKQVSDKLQEIWHFSNTMRLPVASSKLDKLIWKMLRPNIADHGKSVQQKKNVSKVRSLLRRLFKTEAPKSAKPVIKVRISMDRAELEIKKIMAASRASVQK